MLRAIYAFHRFVNGWNDIGYNFVIDAFGRIFEARAGGVEEPVVGAHAGGYNLVSTGVAVLGSFMSSSLAGASSRGARTAAGLEAVAARAARRGRCHRARQSGRRAATAASRRARASRCRASPGTATVTPRTAPATCSTGSCRRIRAGARSAWLDAPLQRPRSRTAPEPRAGCDRQRPLRHAHARSTARRSPARPPGIAGAHASSRRGELRGRAHPRAKRSATRAGRFALPVSALLAALGGAPPRGGLSLRALYAGSAAAGASVSDPVHVPAGALTAPPPPPAPAPTPPTPRLPLGEAALRLGLHEQGRRRARRCPGPARRVQHVVDPGERPVAGVRLDRPRASSARACCGRAHAARRSAGTAAPRARPAGAAGVRRRAPPSRSPTRARSTRRSESR